MLYIPDTWALVLLALLLGMIFITTTVDSPAQIELIEFLEGTEGHVDDHNSTHMIRTNGYWDADILLVHVSATGVDREVAETVSNFIESSDNSTFREWNELLSSFEGNAPILSITQDINAAHIKVMLTDDEHPEGYLGKARLYVIKGAGQIIAAEVEIFAATKMHNQGLLEYAVAHEMGHALGLSHSTDPHSIMHSMLRLENDEVQNHIGSCEEKGIYALYVDFVIGNTVC